MLKQLWTIVLDLVYPPKCPGCRGGVDVHGSWCGACLGRVLAPREISVHLHRLHHLDFCLTVCDYSGGVKRVIHDMKFRQAKKYACHLEGLLEMGVAPGRILSPELVIPVPLHAERLKERGYNQNDLIFKGWAKRQGLMWCSDNLVRTRPTQPQWELKLSERRKNIKDAFVVTRPDDVFGRSILLVDDIITSGTTMDECARTLKKSGARTVCGLTLASGAPN
ncbi:MAG: ComF family protein [Negativicutes bacterium]|nr:ComF family protein [Negativicutes bacterium]